MLGTKASTPNESHIVPHTSSWENGPANRGGFAESRMERGARHGGTRPGGADATARTGGAERGPKESGEVDMSRGTNVAGDKCGKYGGGAGGADTHRRCKGTSRKHVTSKGKCWPFTVLAEKRQN